MTTIPRLVVFDPASSSSAPFALTLGGSEHRLSLRDICRMQASIDIALAAHDAAAKATTKPTETP